MARKKKSRKKSTRAQKTTIEKETKDSIIAIIFFILSLFLTIAGFGGAGVAGEAVYGFLAGLVGVGYALLPILSLFVGLSYITAFSPSVAVPRALSGSIFLLTGLAILDTALVATEAGGIIGQLVAAPFVWLFDQYVAIIILGGGFIISLLLLFNRKPDFSALWERVREFFASRFAKEDEYQIDDWQEEEEPEEESVSEDPEPEEDDAVPVTDGVKEDELSISDTKSTKTADGYTPPPLSMLEQDSGKPNTGDIKANVNVIRRTLQNFGIEVEMDEVTIGPTVTRYALKPAEGVKLSRIVGLQNDLALALAAHPLRIQAPIPGKSLVGIEVPNKTKSTVGLASLLKHKTYAESRKPLLVSIGKDIAGNPTFGDLAKMPHMLIAGATGSGKSVTIHALITSLLYRNSPADLRFIMVDPKRVELTLYNKIPHLLTPVIKQPKKAILALKWAATEMERRYDILESESVRDIATYHKDVVANAAKDAEVEAMPYIVIIIDELADIMQAYPRELESAIVRLAQMSRAVGIHLILSTQRPSVNVITGLIKANIPARIALQVSSQIDSRTILDAGGAEKLLGAGDMLYDSGDMSQPERLQSAFISEHEVKRVVKYLSEAYQDEVPDDIALTDESISPEKSIFSATLEEDEDDELVDEATAVVVEAGKASTSYLQRKLKIGYSRAARIMDILEERGIIGPQEGSKPRDVYPEAAGMSPEEETEEDTEIYEDS